ncbi:MAG: PorV/PorQ family protein [Elusimicrobiota bacterium]
MKRLLSALSVSLLLAGTARHARAAGAEPFNFLFLDGNARAVAMGGAYTALAGDANALLYNPGGLAWVDGHEATFMHNQHFEGITQEYLGFASRSGFGALLNYVDYGSLTRTTISNPDGSGDFGASDLALGGGYGRRFAEDFGVGGALKLIRGSIDGTNAQGYAADFGVLYRSAELQGLKLGAALQNLGPSVKFERNDENLPLNLRFGGAFDFAVRERPVVLALDMTKERSEGLLVNIGAEMRPVELFALRLGYATRNEAGPGVSVGFGVGKKGFGFDYAFVPFGDLGNTHRMSLTLRWGNGELKSYAAAPEPRRRPVERAAAVAPAAPPASKPLASPAPRPVPELKALPVVPAPAVPAEAPAPKPAASKPTPSARPSNGDISE